MPPNHPIADQVESLTRGGKIEEAKPLIEAALQQEPHHPDLLAALGIMYAFAGEEDQAVELLGKAGHTPRARKLAKILTEHLLCRQQMAAKTGKRDGTAHLFLSKVRLTGDRPLDPVGIMLTACLIVKDESKNLRRCLESIKNIVDEIVVVDTGSTDDTVEIAKSYGATVGHFDWCEDFAAARNHALDLATGNWILWIDADEELTPESKNAIQRALVRPHFGGFAIEIVNFTDDESEAAQYVHNPVRLFRFHEQIMPAIAAMDLPWAYLKGAKILHHGYKPSEMESRGKIDRTVTLIEKELADNPEDAFQWFNLANAYTAANDFLNAERAAATCAKHLDDGDSMGKLNYQLWSNALLKQDRAGDAAKVCNEAERRGLGGILNDFERANAYLRLGLLEEALEARNKCMAAEWPSEMTGDASIAEYKRYIVRGQILSLMGQFPEALAMFDRALKVDHTYGPAIYSRAATLEKAGNLESALDGFTTGQTHSTVGQLCLKGAGRVSSLLNLPKRAAEYYRESWLHEPNDHEAWVGWIQAADALGDVPAIVEAYSLFAEKHEPSCDILINWGRALESIGDFDRAFTCYQEAIQREPGNANAYFNCGDLMYKLEAFDRAADLYQAGLRLDGTNASGWFVLGNALARMGAIPSARVSYQQALAIRPDYVEAKQNLETICAAA